MNEAFLAGRRDEDREPDPPTSELLGLETRFVEERPGVSEETSKVVHAMDAESTLLYAFEKAGLIKSLEELGKPINRLLNNSTPSNELNDRRDERSLAAMLKDSDARSAVTQRIDTLINRRREYSKEDVKKLREWGKRKFGHSEVLPAVQQTLKDLILAKDDTDLPKITDEASELAPDVYLIMLRDDPEFAATQEEIA